MKVVRLKSTQPSIQYNSLSLGQVQLVRLEVVIKMIRKIKKTKTRTAVLCDIQLFPYQNMIFKITIFMIHQLVRIA